MPEFSVWAHVVVFNKVDKKFFAIVSLSFKVSETRNKKLIKNKLKCMHRDRSRLLIETIRISQKTGLQ